MTYYSHIYRITGFFCGCKFLRFVSAIGTCNFCDFIFCDFTPLQSVFYCLDNMKNLRVNLKHPRFLWACAFTLKSSSFSALLNTSINPSRNTRVLFLWTKKLIGQEMTQAVGSHSSWFEFRSLDHVYLTTVSSVGAE